MSRLIFGHDFFPHALSRSLLRMSSATVALDDDRSERKSVLARLRALIRGSEECSRLEVRKMSAMVLLPVIDGFHARGLVRTVYASRTRGGRKNGGRVFYRLGEFIPAQQIISPLFCNVSFTDED